MIIVCNGCDRSFKPEQHTDEEDGKTWTDTTCPKCGMDANWTGRREMIETEQLQTHELRKQLISQDEETLEDAKVAVMELAIAAETAAERIGELSNKQIESNIDDIRLGMNNMLHMISPTGKVPEGYHVGDFVVALLHRVRELEDSSAWMERQLHTVLGVGRKVRDHQEADQTVLADLD